MKPALIVHGGAGEWDNAHDAPKAVYMKQAYEAGWAVLASGGSALLAVEKAVNILEDAPLFDAGTGSHLNADGIVEMDAIIVDGTNHDFGAVAGVQRVRYPISLATKVMTETPHKMFVGDGADMLARKVGVQIVPNVALVTAEEWQNFVNQTKSSPTGTVGAVAIDANGNIAAATSTGGTPFKMPGRVGDSPIFGAGAYADSRWGAASATGHGENILRVLLCKYAIDQLEKGLNAPQAAQQAIAHINSYFSVSETGIIVVDKDGLVGFAHSTAKIAVSWAEADGQILTAMRSG
jgi:beta-aspartyl-peptidase (threonine type)